MDVEVNERHRGELRNSCLEWNGRKRVSAYGLEMIIARASDLETDDWLEISGRDEILMIFSELRFDVCTQVLSEIFLCKLAPA